MNEQEKQEVAFAAMGKQVLGNKAYQEAIIARKAQIFDIFCNTKPDQGDVREEAWRTMINMQALDDYFQQLLDTGKMAERTLKEIEEQNDVR